MSNDPLGFFDSGVGGLTVVRAARELLPQEDILYLGDTARVPYGSKSPETIRRFALEDAKWLIDHGVKAIVVACNTATAHALELLRKSYDIPILGVIEAGIEATLADESTTRVGIIATRGTIRSHAYQHALAQKRTGLIIHAQAAPLLVPLIEEDWLQHHATEEILQTYLRPMLDRGIDSLLLACTHYPMLTDLLVKILPKEVRLIDSATTCAHHLEAELNRLNLRNTQPGHRGELQIHLTDVSEELDALAGRFLSTSPGKIHRAIIA